MRQIDTKTFDEIDYNGRAESYQYPIIWFYWNLNKKEETYLTEHGVMRDTGQTIMVQPHAYREGDAYVEKRLFQVYGDLYRLYQYPEKRQFSFLTGLKLDPEMPLTAKEKAEAELHLDMAHCIVHKEGKKVLNDFEPHSVLEDAPSSGMYP